MVQECMTPGTPYDSSLTTKIATVEYHFEEPWAITYYLKMGNNFLDVLLIFKLYTPLDRGHGFVE